MKTQNLVLANFVLRFADGAFDLALGLVELTFHFQLGVAGDFAGSFSFTAPLARRRRR